MDVGPWVGDKAQPLVKALPAPGYRVLRRIDLQHHRVSLRQELTQCPAAPALAPQLRGDGEMLHIAEAGPGPPHQQPHPCLPLTEQVAVVLRMAQHPLLPLPKALLVDGKALHIEVIEPVEARIARGDDSDVFHRILLLIFCGAPAKAAGALRALYIMMGI